MEESPFAIPSKKLVMWLFIISDAVTFAAILFAYGYLRNATPDWPRPFKFSPSIVNVIFMTFILVTSSLTMLMGVRAAKAGDKSGAIRWTFITAAGGLLFALLHIREWLGLIKEGVRLFQNPWGSGLFGAAFFSITGLHLAHVIGGVIALVVVALRYKRGRYNSDDIEISGLYWHFVDLVWMFVVPFVYLLNVAR
jgi:cytochrome c oxidase subunit 3